jgi:DNA-binding MarR family transcriptional regulator
MSPTISRGDPVGGAGMLPTGGEQVDVMAATEVVERFFRALRAGGSARWLQIDLTLSQLKVMFTLAQAGGASVGEIAQLLGIGNAGASLLVDRLVRLGFAQRTEDPADRRRTIVELSPAGMNLVRELIHGGRDHLHRVLIALPPEDLAALLRGVGAAARVAETLAQESTEKAAGEGRASP